MAATLQLQDDVGNPITAWPFGAVAAGASTQTKFQLANVGDSNATSTTISLEAYSQNDGVNFLQIANDVGGNPGTFGTAPLSLGTLIPGQVVKFWTKIAVTNGVTPQGNPRYFKVEADYTGT